MIRPGRMVRFIDPSWLCLFTHFSLNQVWVLCVDNALTHPFEAVGAQYYAD